MAFVLVQLIESVKSLLHFPKYIWVGVWAFLVWLFRCDTPSLPWRWGECTQASLFENFHTRPLALLLQTMQPQLLAQWFAIVAPAAAAAHQAERQLDELRLKKQTLAAEHAAAQSLVEPDPDKTLKTAWDGLLNVGLALMLFLGLAEPLGLELQNFSQAKLPLFYLALLGAVCLTVGAKLMVIRWVRATRSHEPKRNFEDDPHHSNTVPFWSRWGKGDTAVYLSGLVVGFEIAFAGPGFMTLLPPNLQDQVLVQLSAFIGTGIAALINIGLAWGTALEQLRLEQLRLEGFGSPSEQTRREIHQKVAATEAELQELIRQLGAIARRAKDLRIRANLEHKRWERAVKRWFKGWIRSDPKRLERFNQLYAEVDDANHGFSQIKILP